MKMIHSTLVCATALLFAPSLTAAPVLDAKTPSPQIVVQAQPIQKILDKVTKSLKTFAPADAYKEIEQEILGKIDPKKLEGLDLKRPFGLYASVDAGLLQGNFDKSSVVVMVPVTGEKEFVALLEKGKIAAEKKDGYYLLVNNTPFEISMRFLKDYAYIGIAGKNLETKYLLDPKDVISSKETALLVSKIRFDLIPEDLRGGVVELLDKATGFAEGIDLEGKQKEGVLQIIKVVLGWYKMGITDGRELVKRVDLDPETGELRVEVTLDGKPQSKLAKSIAGIPQSKNDFVGIIGKDSVGHILLTPPLYNDNLRNALHTLSEAALDEFTAKSKGMPEELVKAGTEAIKLLGRTVKSGDMSLAASLRGPNKDGLFTAIGAVRLEDTAGLEKAVRASVKLAPEKIQKAVKLDAAKIDGIAVHEIDFTGEIPGQAARGFGKNAKAYMLFAPNAILFAFGPEGMTMLKDAVTQKGGPAPVIQMQINPDRMAKFIKAVAQPEGPGAAWLEQFGKLGPISLVTIDVSGGEKLTVKYNFAIVPAMLWVVPRAASVGANAAPPAVKVPAK
jgi:hypothetical protein